MTVFKSIRKMASNGVDCYVKLPSGKTITIDLLPSDTVNNIYTAVAKDVNVSTDRVVIKYTGKVLNRSHTVGYLGICKETILKSEIIQIKMLNVFVKIPGGKTIPVKIENVSPVRYIMDHINIQEGIDCDTQHLKVCGREITNPNQKCMDAGIMDESIITLEIKEIQHEPEQKKQNETENELSEKDKEALIGSFDANGRPVEVLFSFDTTGSMYTCLEQVRSKLNMTVRRLIQHIPSIRIGIIAHGDYCDYHSYVLRSIDLTSDIDALVEFVKNVPSTGGGDAPECYEWVLRKAQQFDWSETAAKALVVIGDDIPHVPSYTDQNIYWHDELDVLKGMDIKVYGIRADHGTHSVNFYEELAEHTGGAYITFRNFSIIADMFLAVCYKESSEEQFVEFCEEVAAEANEGSNKAADVKEMLQQIKESHMQHKKQKKYFAVPWWDTTLDHGSPCYAYNAVADKWTEYNRRHKPIFNTDSHSSCATSATESKSLRNSIKTRFSFKNKSDKRHTSTTGHRTMKKMNTKKSCSIM